MRLNGWQRLWVVGTILWTPMVGVGTWQTWPKFEGDYVSLFPVAGTPESIGYYDAVATIANAAPPDWDKAASFGGKSEPVDLEKEAAKFGGVSKTKSTKMFEVQRDDGEVFKVEAVSAEEALSVFKALFGNKDGSPVIATVLPSRSEWSLVVEVATVGKVEFPAGMTTAQITTATRELVAEHQRLLNTLNQGRRRAFFYRKIGAIRVAVALWLLPPLLLYLLGWAAGWVYRGFRTS